MQIQVTLIGISRFFSADEIENLVITAAEAFCGQLDHLSTRQRDLATRAHALLTADSMPTGATSVPASPAEPAAEVWVLRHDDKHGDDMWLYASRTLALGALAQTVRSRWDNIVGDPGVPATGDALTDEAAVEIYFRHRTGIESYSIYSEQVDSAGAARPPHGLSETDAETLITLAALTAGEHHSRPDQGSTAYLRALSELNQGPVDSAELHDLGLRALTQMRTGMTTRYRHR
jgi:hypothetical protein